MAPSSIKPSPSHALRLNDPDVDPGTTASKYTEIIMDESLGPLKDKLEQALKLADDLELKVVGAWISVAIDALSIEGETA